MKNVGVLSFLPLLVVAAQPCLGDSELDPAFIDQINTLNELTDRRRINTFFVNEQSVFYGVQKGYVNVGKGNFTFLRRDLVTVGRVPVVLLAYTTVPTRDRRIFPPAGA